MNLLPALLLVSFLMSVAPATAPASAPAGVKVMSFNIRYLNKRNGERWTRRRRNW